MPVDFEKVERLRKSAELTQQQAADAIGLSGKAHWSNIINGVQDISVTQLDKIAKLFKVKTKELLK